MTTITCMAAVVWAPNEMTIETVEVAPPKKGEARIKMVSISPCHTDVTFLEGKAVGEYGPWFPVVLGHEGAGIVESIGEDVTSLVVGDKVVTSIVPNCQKCFLCQHPRGNACFAELEGHSKALLPDMTSRFTCKGKQLFQMTFNSCWSEYTVCPEFVLCKLNPEMPMELASIFGCGFPTGYGTPVNAAKVRPGSVCAVWGLGGVGLSAIIGLKRCEAKKIFAIDINPSKFEIAKKLGATDCVNPKIVGDVVAYINKETDGMGCDYTFEFVGSPFTMKQAIEASNFAYGEAHLIGVVPNGKELFFDPMLLITGRSVHSGRLGNYKMREDVLKLSNEFVEGKLPGVELLISHRLKFGDIGKAIKLMHEGGIRIVLSF